MFTDIIKPAEILAAAPDYLALQMGIAPDRPHPLASDLSMRKVAHSLGLKVRPQQGHEDDRAVVARGLGSADFSKMLAASVRGVSVAVYDQASTEYMGFCTTVEAQNFQPQPLPGLDGDLALRLLSEFAEVQHGLAFSAAGATLQLSTYARICAVSRQLLVNDEFQAIKSIFQSVGAHTAQLEASLIADTLSAATPTLDDGAPVFDAGNSVGSALDATSLGSAMALLRTQTNASGNPLNLRAQHLVCSPALEYTARKLVLDAGLDIEVAALAGLDAARWFVLPSPDVHPVIALVRLAGNSKTPLRIEQKTMFGNDAVGIRAIADLGVTFLRRTGIVKGGA